MKKIIVNILLLLPLGVISLIAQETSTQGINYQAYFQDDLGKALKNETIKIEVNLISGNEIPELFYQEIQ